MAYRLSFTGANEVEQYNPEERKSSGEGGRAVNKQKMLEEVLLGSNVLELQEFMEREDAFLTLRKKKGLWHAQVVHQSGLYGSARDEDMLVALRAAVILFEESVHGENSLRV